MSFELPVDRPAIMGVLNVTPDSFSDGGKYEDVRLAVARGVQMFEEGADLIDVGGESTRPGADAVCAEEELRRTVPVVEALVDKGVPVSIDTSKPQVAKACTELGARVVNDVTALRSDRIAEVCAEAGCTVCLMHMQGDPRTMQADPNYADVVQEVCDELDRAADRAMRAGIKKENIWIDPGIGFGKTVEHNLTLLNSLDTVGGLGYPVLIGVSRKSFISKLLGGEKGPLPPEQRLEGTLAAQVVAQMKGARVIRAHDVKEAVRASRMTTSILSARPS